MLREIWQVLVVPNFGEIILLALIALSAKLAPTILRQTRPHPWLLRQNRVLVRLKFKSYEEFLDLFVRQNLIFCAVYALAIGPTISFYVGLENVWFWFATVSLTTALGMYFSNRRRKAPKGMAFIYGIIHFVNVLIFLAALYLSNGNILVGFAGGFIYWLFVYGVYFSIAYKHSWLLLFRP